MKAFAAPSHGPTCAGSSGDGGRDDPGRGGGKKTADLDNRPFFADEDEDDDTPFEDENGVEVELR